MKKLVFILFAATSTLANAQDHKLVPQISVAGEGKVKVAPDFAIITVGVENSGADATDVKKKNDTAIDAVIKFLKKSKIAEADYQTQRVSLNKNYDYDKKKYNYSASQTIAITLKDLKGYDVLMTGLVDSGINNIQGVEFKSTKLAQYESEARVKAVADAKLKANDYATALGQRVGKAILVSDNTQPYYPRPMMSAMKMNAGSADMAPETLAIGEIEITSNVSISFMLE